MARNVRRVSEEKRPTRRFLRVLGGEIIQTEPTSEVKGLTG